MSNKQFECVEIHSDKLQIWTSVTLLPPDSLHGQQVEQASTVMRHAIFLHPPRPPSTKQVVFAGDGLSVSRIIQKVVKEL